MALNIFHYLDYRSYINDVYVKLSNEKDRRFSHRSFAKLCGSTIPSFLKLLKSRRIHLNDKTIRGIINGFDLSKFETEYFKAIVKYDQAKTFKEKEKFYGKVLIIRARQNGTKIEQHQLKYYSKWYYSAVWALLGFVKFNPLRDSYTSLGRLLNPTLGAKVIQTSLKLILKLGLIKVGIDGCYTQTSSNLITGPKPAIEVKKFQIETAGMAVKALTTQNPKNIEFSTLTSYISKDGFKKIKERIIQARKDIMNIAQMDLGEDRVYQLNFQFFPVTKIKGD